MNVLIVLAALAALLLGYLFYGRYLAKKWGLEASYVKWDLDYAEIDGDGIVRPKRLWTPGDDGDGGGEDDDPEIRRRAIAWCYVVKADEFVCSWK